MEKKQTISISGFDYDESRKENGWIKNFPVQIGLNPDNTLAGFSQPITDNAFKHMRAKFRSRLKELFSGYSGGSLKDETVEVTFGKEAILMLLSQPNAAGITFTFGVNDIPDNKGIVKERVTLMARGARPCHTPKGYEVIREEDIRDRDKKKRGNSKSVSKKNANAPVASAASTQSSHPDYIIFEVVPRSTFSDPLS